jgi:serine/threonine protein kinase
LNILVEGCDVSQFEAGEVEIKIEIKIEIEIENLSNLRHPLITSPIRFEFLEVEGQLKILRLHAAGRSLAGVFLARRVLWTPMAKAEAVVGIALVLQFAHGLGLLHGGLKVTNDLFDDGGRFQIANFNPIRRDGGFSGEDWIPRADVSAFAMLLVNIVTGYHLSLPVLSVAQVHRKVILTP